MKFNILLAKQGYPVFNRNGQKVRIICYDREDSIYPIVALVKTNDGNEEIMDFTVEGRHIEGEDDQFDLRLEGKSLSEEEITKKKEELTRKYAGCDSCRAINCVHEKCEIYRMAEKSAEEDVAPLKTTPII